MSNWILTYGYYPNFRIPVRFSVSHELSNLLKLGLLAAGAETGTSFAEISESVVSLLPAAQTASLRSRQIKEISVRLRFI
jgi:hypothetical protein